MSVIVDSKYRGPHDNTERKTFMCDPQHMHRWVIVVSCLSQGRRKHSGWSGFGLTTFIEKLATPT